MKLFTQLVIFLTLLTNCTDNSKTDKAAVKELGEAPTTVFFESPLTYRYDNELEKKGITAQFGNESINQHNFNDVKKSLATLNAKIIREIAYVGFYWAQLDLKKKELETSILKTSFPIPDSFKMKLKSDASHEIGSKIKLIDGTTKERPFEIWVNDKPYTEAEISLGSLELAKLRHTSFKVKLESLELAIVSRVISKKAKAANLAPSRFVNQQILEKIDVSASAVEKYALKNNIPSRELDNSMRDKVRGLIRSSSSQQMKLQYAAKHLSGQPVKISFLQPRLKIYPINSAVTLPTLGHGPLSITLICNFNDEACRIAVQNIDHFLSRIQDQINLKYIFRFQLDDRAARTSSEASLCVNKLAPTQFWDYSKKLVDSNLKINEPNINKIVGSLDLDFNNFRECMAKGMTRLELKEHLALTRTLGQVKVPILLVGNHYYQAPLNYELIGQQIKESLSNIKTTAR